LRGNSLIIKNREFYCAEQGIRFGGTGNSWGALAGDGRRGWGVVFDQMEHGV
jgi:hypothetical protein